MGFFCKQNTLATDSTSPTTYSVSDRNLSLEPQEISFISDRDIYARSDPVMKYVTIRIPRTKVSFVHTVAFQAALLLLVEFLLRTEQAACAPEVF